MSNRSFGNQGEQFVVSFLEKQGFTIATQNYRKFFGEIDIIAYKPQLYIFVEVKTRRSTLIAMGQLISILKQQKIIKTAQNFIAQQKLYNCVYRFDVALVQPDGTTFSVEYIENAFTKPESNYGDKSY